MNNKEKRCFEADVLQGKKQLLLTRLSVREVLGVCEVSVGMARNGGHLQLSPVFEKRPRGVTPIQEC